MAAELATATHAAQEPTVGPNVNLVGGPTYLKISPDVIVRGDPLRAQQFESSCAFNSRQPLHLFCVSGDNRLVDTAGLDTFNEDGTGDSTIGMFQSIDGGLTWQSQPIPGTRYDAIASPIKNFEAAADASAAAAAAGVVHASAIVFNRGENGLGAVAVWTFVDANNGQGDPFPAKHVMTRLWDQGTPGQFIDRPAMIVTAPPLGATATYQAPLDDGTILTQTVPASPIHLAYTVFLGNDKNIRTKVMYSQSYDGGYSNSTPIKLSEGYAINQGIQIAQLQNSAGKLCVVWRRGQSNGSNNEFDAIMAACSSDRGYTFTKAAPLRAQRVCPLDQETGPTRSRIRAVPSIAADASRFYVVWSERPRDVSGACTAGDSRVVVSTSTDGVNWSTPSQVDAYQGRGHQINPTIVVGANGKLNVLWEDFRNDASGLFESLIDEMRIVTNSPALSPRRRHTRDVFAAEGQTGASPAWSKSFQVSQYIFGEIPPSEQNKITVGTTRQQLQWNPFNIRLFNRLSVAGTTDYNWITTESIVPADPVARPGEWTRNAGQLGDPFVFYSWTDGRNIKLIPNEDYSHPRPYAAPNLQTLIPGGQSVFDPTQNRAACSQGLPGTKNLDVYGALKTQGIFAGAPGNNKSTVNLDRAFTMFGQNMTGVEKILRFAIAVQPPGGADTMATFNQRFPSLPFAPQVVADAVVASKNVVARTVYVPKQPKHPIAVDVSEVNAKPIAALTSSGMMATAFAPGHGYQTGQLVIVAGAHEPAFNGTFAVASVSGDVFTYVLDVAAPAIGTGTPRTASVSNLRAARRVWLNFDPTQPANLAADTMQGDGFDINKFEVYNVEFALLQLSEIQEIGFPTVNGEGWQTPGWETPGWETPGWETPGWETPGWETPGWETPGWETPGWETPGWETPSLSDSDIQNSSIKDVPRKLKNNSNSYVSVNLRALVNGALPDDLKFQAVVYKLYTTPVTNDCREKLVGNTQVLLNISNLDVSAANFNSPNDSSSLQNLTVFLAPHEEVYFNVRVYDTAHRGSGANMFDPVTLILKATPQPVGTVDIINGVITPPPVFSDLALLAGTLPNGQAGQPYSAAVQAIGGTPPLSFSARGLPAGIAINSTTGALGGTTTVAGDFTIAVSVSDAAFHTATRTYSLHIDSGPAAGLAFLTQPSSGVAGQPITPAPQVQVVDAFGNLAPLSSAAITLTLGNAQNATLLGTTTRSAAFGVASFPNLSIAQVGSGYQLVATSEALATATSSAFDMSAPPASTFVVTDTDFTSAGFGGMRGDGSGTLTLAGVSGSVKQALLFWHGPTNSNDVSANSNVVFGGQQVTGTNIGFAEDNNWGFSNSQAYRADVTSIVTGNGSYSLSGFRKVSNEVTVADVNGASLIVFFDDGNSENNQDVYGRSTNDSNVVSAYDAADWSDVLTGVNYAAGTATLQLHVGDGQGYLDGAISLNGTVVVAAGPIFQGNTVPNGPNPGGIGNGGLWDVMSWNIPAGILAAGSNTITLTSPADADALSLVVMIVSVPHVP